MGGAAGKAQGLLAARWENFRQRVEDDSPPPESPMTPPGPYPHMVPPPPSRIDSPTQNISPPGRSHPWTPHGHFPPPLDTAP